MPGPALTVQINADTSQLAIHLDQGTSKLGGFIDNVTGIITSMGGITGVADLAVQGLQKLVEIGGPEAAQAMEGLQTTVNEQLAPVFEALAPLIVKLVEGLTKLASDVLPIVVPILLSLVARLGDLFDGLGKVWEALQPLIDRLQPLIDQLRPIVEELLPPLLSLLGDLTLAAVDFTVKFVEVVVDGFQKIWDVIQKVIDIIANVQHALQGIMDAIGSALGTIQDLLDKLASITSFQLPDVVGGIQDALPGGIFPFMAPSSVTISTLADPSAVTRQLRRYSASNGGGWGRAPRRGSVQLRGW